MKKNIFIILAFILICGNNIFAQVTIGSITPPEESAALQVISPDNDKGILIPKLSQEQRDGIVNPSNGLMVFNTDENCYNYYNAANHEWNSLCGGSANATGVVECQSATLSGTLIQGTPANSGNYLTVPVTVSKEGLYYAITAMPVPANGYYFTASGSFPAPGTYYVNLFANGVPTNASQGDDISLTFNGELADCAGLKVPVNPAAPDYTITNVVVVPSVFPVGSPLLPTDHYLNVTLSVKNPGQWALMSGTINGYSFGAHGNISQASGYNPGGFFPQTVTVTVPVTGGQVNNYVAAGDNFTLSNSGSITPSSYPFNVPLAAVSFSINCGSASVSGDPFKQNVALTNQSVSVKINVTSPGTTTLYATGAGMRFTSGALQLSAGETTITLLPETPSGPITSGNQSLLFSSGNSGSRSVCSIPVVIQSATAIIDKMSFISTTPNTGNYIIDVNGNQSAYVTLSVVSSTAGEYSFSTEEKNGVTYKASGSLIASAQPQTVILYPEGDAKKVGPQNYTLTANGKVINFDINYVYRAMKILVIGRSSDYDLTNVKRFINTSAANASYPEGDKNFGSKGIVPTAGVTITTSNEKVGGADRTNVVRDLFGLKDIEFDIVLIGFNNNQWSKNDVDAMVNYVKRRGVLFVATENYINAYAANNTIRDVIAQVFGTSTINHNNSSSNLWYSGSINMGTYVAENNSTDPILNGKFGSIAGKYLGNDYAGTSNVLVGTLPDNAISLARPHPQANNTSSIKDKSWYSIRHNDLAFVWAGDAGFWGAWEYSTTNGRDTSPVGCSPASGSPLFPQKWTPNMDGSGVAGPINVYNGTFLMNFLGYAIEYAGTHKRASTR